MSTCNVRRAETSLTSMVADTNQQGKQRQTFRLIYDNPKEHSHITQQTHTSNNNATQQVTGLLIQHLTTASNQDGESKPL